MRSECTRAADRNSAERDPAEHGVVALMEVPDGATPRYGIATAEPTGSADVVRVTGLIEKPAPGPGPSNLAVIGALQRMVSDAAGTGGVHGVIFRGRRYRTGDRLDYLKAVVRLAVDHDDLGPDLESWLTEGSRQSPQPGPSVCFPGTSGAAFD